MRGTLRYKGFSLLARSLIQLGLFAEDPVPKECVKDNWFDFLTALLQGEEEKKISRLSEGKLIFISY